MSINSIYYQNLTNSQAIKMYLKILFQFKKGKISIKKFTNIASNLWLAKNGMPRNLGGKYSLDLITSLESAAELDWHINQYGMSSSQFKLMLDLVFKPLEKKVN